MPIGKHYDLDTDVTLANNSDNTIASQKATKAYIDNKVNNKTITIQKNSTTVDSFTLNQSTDKTINISVPTTVAELSDSSNYVQTSSLEEAATVAKTGDYNDLINKPTIPTVGNAEIEIQKNSVKVDSFTTNQSGNKKTINITVPTKTSDITNDSGFLTSHQSIKTLKTDNTATQTTSSSEAIAGSGTINLHKVSKTGSYSDLLDKPTIDTALSTTSTNTVQNKIITTELNKKIQQNDILQDLNHHALQPRFRFFSSTLNNVLYRSDKRHTVTLTNFNTSNSSTLFDMNFDSNIRVLAGKIGTVNITGSTYNIGMDYPYGWLYVSFYGSNGITDLSQISAKVYQDWSGHNTGWVDITNSRQIVSSRNDNGTTRIYTVSFYTQNYGLRQIEISIDNTDGVGKEDTNVWVTQIEFFCQRTGVGSFPILTKLGGTVNGNITIPTTDGSFIGNLTGTADKATKDADGNTISTTYLKTHQSIKTLNTNNTTAQTASASEAIAGSGTINLHKVSKTGSYSDLLNKPTIPATNVIPATTTANKVLISTTTSGTAKWSDFSSAGFLKTNSSGVISVDTTSYGTYSKPSGGIPASDLAESYYLASNPNGYTSNAGTVTSVRVQAGTGLASSTSTAQSTTLNTTISIASGYKLPTTTEWSNKQDKLTTQTAYTSKGSATKVPQITTNTLGQVTGITEVDITHPTELPSQTGQSGKFLTTNGSAVSWADASVEVDNSTITKNGSNQIQTVGYKDVRTSNTLKTWTGTRAQYDAIATKDSNTLYNITDDTDTTAAMLELLYPVGAVYIGTMDVCPLATLGIGSWETQISRFLVEQKVPTSGDGSWYNLYSDGWCEQGGTIQTSAASGGVSSAVVTFSKPFIDGRYDFNADVVVNSDNTALYLTGLSSRSTTSVTISSKYIAGGGFGAAGSVTYRWTCSYYTSITSNLKMWRRIS